MAVQNDYVKLTVVYLKFGVSTTLHVNPYKLLLTLSSKKFFRMASSFCLYAGISLLIAVSNSAHVCVLSLGQLTTNMPVFDWTVSLMVSDWSTGCGSSTYQKLTLNQKNPSRILHFKTYPADCRKIAAVDSNKHDWDRKNRRY